MTVVATIQQKLSAAAQDPAKLGNFTRPIVYRTPDGIEYSVARAFVSKVGVSETDGEAIQVTDVKFKILQNEIPVQPKMDGTVVMNGREYLVGPVKGVSGGVNWTLYARG